MAEVATEVEVPKKKKKQLTPEQLERREERKTKRAAKEVAFEKALSESRVKRPVVWKSLDTLITEITKLPQEEGNVDAQLVSRVFKNRLRPGRKAVSREKLEEKKAKMLKALAALDERLAAVPKA